jgi:hypothetical protein
LAAEELAEAGAALQKLQEFFERKAALLEDIRERALRNFGVHRNYGFPGPCRRLFFQAKHGCPSGGVARILHVSKP